MKTGRETQTREGKTSTDRIREGVCEEETGTREKRNQRLSLENKGTSFSCVRISFSSSVSCNHSNFLGRKRTLFSLSSDTTTLFFQEE